MKFIIEKGAPPEAKKIILASKLITNFDKQKLHVEEKEIRDVKLSFELYLIAPFELYSKLLTIERMRETFECVR